MSKDRISISTSGQIINETRASCMSTDSTIGTARVQVKTAPVRSRTVKFSRWWTPLILSAVWSTSLLVAPWSKQVGLTRSRRLKTCRPRLNLIRWFILNSATCDIT